MNNKKIYKNQKGQALLFVIVALTISLAIGVGVSVRTISSLSRTTRSDTASRALAAAEGGIERYLTLSNKQLEDAVSGICPEGTEDLETEAGCQIKFESSSDAITSQAIVTVVAYQPDFYPFELVRGEVKEINLDTYKDDEIKICWSSLGDGSDLLFFTYDNAGILSNGGITSNNEAPKDPDYEQSGFISANEPGNSDYNVCETINTGNNPYGLRLRTLGGDSKIGVYGVNDAIPLQGYEITSVGSLVQNTDVVASRKIRVVRSLPYLPAAFDFSLYSKNQIEK